MLPAGLALLALLAALRFPSNQSRGVTASAAAVLALALAVELAFAFVPHGVVQNVPSRPFVLAEKSAEPSDWSSYGRTTAGTRYSPFTQINRENVGELKLVWTFRSGDDGPGMDQNTPLQIGDSSTPARVTLVSRRSMRTRAQCAGATTPAWSLPRGRVAAVSATTSCADAPRDGRPHRFARAGSSSRRSTRV